MPRLSLEEALQLALQHHQVGQLQEAEQFYRHVLAINPRHATATHHLGLIALQVGQKLIAVNLITKAIGLDPSCAEAYNNLANALVEIGQIPEAVNAYRRAISIKPDYAAAMSNLGALLKDSGKISEAIEAYRRALVLSPTLTEAHYNLGDALVLEGKLVEAVVCYENAIRLIPNYAEAFNNMGHALHRLGKLEEAAASIRNAIQLRADFPEALCNLGNVLADQGFTDGSIAAQRQALLLRPDYAEAHLNLGSGLIHKGLIDAGIACYQRALLIRPTFAEAFSNLGTVYLRVGKTAESISAFSKSVELKPDFFEAYYNLANALSEAGHAEKSLMNMRKAVALNGAHPETWHSLGNILRSTFNFDEATAAYKTAISLRPNYAEAFNGLGNALKETGLVDQAVSAYRTAVRLDANSVEYHSNLIFMLNYQPSCSRDELAAEKSAWNARHATPLIHLIKPHKKIREDHRRMRIGYISADFLRHAVGQNLLPLFKFHDRERFEIHCYSNVKRPDDFTTFFRQHSDDWHDIARLADAQVAEQVRLDQIDILVDLSLHTAHHRLLVFAQKPAPVQVSFAGYPGDTGLEAIEYNLSDPFLVPPEHGVQSISSRTIELKHSFWCFDPGVYNEIRTTALPALKNNYITFGNLNNFCKVNDITLQRWAEVLLAVDRSRMMMLTPEGISRERIGQFFQVRGIDPTRITFVSRMPRKKYLEQYHQIDIGLDTFPYNGHTTSLDSFWMGVPVVTMIGNSPVSRAGWSQLSNLGLTHLAAKEESEFKEIAVGLSSNLSQLADLRSTLRARMESSPLMDATAFARSIEAAYLRMWQNNCS